MNALNPSSNERDLDALRRAQRAHEPSMEEILASIRSIIADDREPAGRVQPPAAGPQIVYSNESAPAARPSAPAAQTQAPESAAASPPTPKVVWSQPEPEPEPEPVAAYAEPEPAEPLASPQTDDAVAASFGALSASVAMHSAEMIEGLMREMLRPMLKTWLDENLPSVVERLVRAEIQRVARGGR